MLSIHMWLHVGQDGNIDGDDPVKQERRGDETTVTDTTQTEDNARMIVKEELLDDDCDLEMKIRIVDNMIPLTKAENSDLKEFT